MGTKDYNDPGVHWLRRFFDSNDYARHVRDWLRWSRLNDHDAHVQAWARRRPLRTILEARARQHGVSSERLERLSALGFLDAYSEVAADQVIAERQRNRRNEK